MSRLRSLFKKREVELVFSSSKEVEKQKRKQEAEKQKAAEAKTKVQEKPKSELERLVDEALASGELTLEERNMIPDFEQNELPVWGKMDYETNIRNLEALIAEKNWEELGIALIERKRLTVGFAEAIQRRFSKYYTIVNIPPREPGKWAESAEEALCPPMLVTYTTAKGSWQFAVAYRWRIRFTKHGLALMGKAQLARFKLYERLTGIPVFCIFGVGGDEEHPEHIFQLPLREMENSFIPKPIADKCEHELTDPLYYDPDNQLLR